MELLKQCQRSHLRDMNKYKMHIRIFVKENTTNSDFLKKRKGLTELFNKRQK